MALAALRDPEPSVRGQALLGLGFILPAGCVGEVVRLLDDDDHVVRAFAAGVLARLGDRSVLSTLHAHLERETEDLPVKAMTESIEKLESGDQGGTS